VRVALLDPAAKDVLEAIEYYESQAAGLSAALADDLDRALQVIAGAPGAGAPHSHDTRRVLLRRFPYGVVYRPLEDRVIVVAFAHLRRRPGHCSDRL
jgi:plasmid stabilization system protein ParE